jgi:hypothetical protein
VGDEVVVVARHANRWRELGGATQARSRRCRR